MDELLHSRIEQLKRIDEELERISRTCPDHSTVRMIGVLQHDIAVMVQDAVAEYRAF